MDFIKLENYIHTKFNEMQRKRVFPDLNQIRCLTEYSLNQQTLYVKFYITSNNEEQRRTIRISNHPIPNYSKRKLIRDILIKDLNYISKGTLKKIREAMLFAIKNLLFSAHTKIIHRTQF